MTLAIYTSAAWTANGGITVAAGATVEVRTYGSGQPLAAIFSDRAGATPKGNPFTADAQGRFSFFAAGGAYRVKVTDGAAEHVLEYQAVGTAGERDTGTGAAEVPTNSDLGSASLADTGTEPDELPTNTQRLRQITIDGDSNHTLTDAEATADIIRLTGALTAPRDLVVPDVARKYTFVNDRTGNDTTVKTSAGTGVVVPRGEVSRVYSDGTNVEFLDFPPIDEDDMASDSDERVPTQQSVKTYADGLVADKVDAVTATDTLTWHEANGQSVASSSYATIFDIASATELIVGTIYSQSAGFRLTIDGTVVIDRPGQMNGETITATNAFSVVSLPTARASSSMKLELYNASAGTRQFGYRVATR